MALSVKAYLLILQDQQEIRRFSIDDGASSNFDYLLTKIKTVFPALRNKPLRLFWKDEDGELVTFSSDEELVEALGSMQGDVFRVYVKVSDGQEATDQHDNSQSTSQAEHVGVVCDGCDYGIFGTRYKCVVCPDYDLCMKCELKGLHNEHEMLRIHTPRSRPGCHGGSFSFFMPPFGPHHPPGCSPQQPPGFGPWGRGHYGHFRGGPRSGRGRCSGARGRCGKTPDAKHEQHKEEAATNSQEVPVGPPFLHAMGEALANFLGPMGVEVHTYTDNEKDCCQGKCNCDHGETKPDESAASSSQGSNRESDAENVDCQNTNSFSTDKTEETTPTDDYVMIDKDKKKDTDTTDAATATEVIPEDPLEIAIAQMQAMGFEDHDGWLSHLIVAKEYDIGKVLDAIQYSDKK